MATHVRVLAFLHIGLGALGVVAAAIVFGVAGSISSLIDFAGPEMDIPIGVVQIIATLIVGVILVLSLPGLIAGFGLLGFHAWARVLTLILCAMNLLNFPFGTALGLYGFWVLLKPEGEMLFQAHPARA